MGSNDLAIYLTEKCNMECDYCYYNKNFFSTLNIGEIRTALDHFFRQADAKPGVSATVLGGEPLMEKELLFRTIDAIRSTSKRYGKKAKIILFTNGSLLTRAEAGKLISKNVNISLSFDGVKESQVSYRKMRDGTSSFDTIMNAVTSFPKGMIERMGVNMVIGPRNCAHLMQSVEFLSGIGFRAMDISLMNYLEWPRESFKTLVDQLSMFHDYYISLFERGTGRRFAMYQLYDLLGGGWNKMDYCGRVKLAPDGRFYFCDAFFSVDSKERQKYSIGDADRGFSQEKIEAMKTEARNAVMKIFPSSFILHRQNRMLYCPYGVYFYSKLNGTNLEKSLRNYYSFSYIYSSMLRSIFDSLKGNKDFLDFYKTTEYPNSVKPG